jgi:hypothetical protein
MLNMRTTLEIDDPILRDVKRIAKRNRKSIGRVVSDLLAKALGEGPASRAGESVFNWNSREMGAIVDIGDKDALYRALDGADGSGPSVKRP